MTLLTYGRTPYSKSPVKRPVQDEDNRHGSSTIPEQKRSRVVDSAPHFPKVCEPIDVATVTPLRVVLPDEHQADVLEDRKEEMLYETMKIANADDTNWNTLQNNPPRELMLGKGKSTGDDANGADEDDCVIVGVKSIDICNGKSLDNDDRSSNQCAFDPVVPETSCLCDQGEASKDIGLMSSLEWENLKQKQSEKGADLSGAAQRNLGEMRMQETGVQELKTFTSYDAAVQSFSRKKVAEVLKLYQDNMQSLNDRDGAQRSQVPTKAVMMLKKENKWLNVQPSFGHIPGVQIGDQFQFRAELVLVGLHHEFIRGINCTCIDGTIYAVSVVDSGRYENETKSSNVLVYSGEGGNSKVQTKQQQGGQKLEGGNLGLKNTMDAKFPVRVIRKIQRKSEKQFYMYDGLYYVNAYWPEISEAGGRAYKFEMIRMSDQSKPIKSFEDSKSFRVLIAEDLSKGKEKVEIMVVNDISDEKPTPFTYITEMINIFPHEPSVLSGCDCTDGCSDSRQCPCVIKNNGEVPFNEYGRLLETKDMIYECGPNCKCPPSCHNRVSQHGLKIPLEVFKTKSTGWGVRSRREIKSGSFICEYLGELVKDHEADCCANDEYLFDLGDGNVFAIDAAKCGNVSRFINHSCSPNLYAQDVLYDHLDERLPHVMLFATEDIPALVELTYDYNYEIGSVCYPDGSIKEKKCFCGSPSCTGRLY
ncbi:OLC1v1003776C1 [Oldenlandia corymbosa var. corymbosa]|uniref:OLC1v1003776C1 n=1 Tax=Oldenlandia corymbosa var. corymbosa TaxID=529605 RepID=A0AAV1DC28_OLDCO|nr:OLC1v1003776C1 [Oldenlandia corymbosa var. corymbosa]